jgi:Tol biopolymer transport system component
MKIAFNSSRSGSYEIWTCDREGRNPVQLTSYNGPQLGSPRWSPDSRWIAFDNPRGNNSDIYVIGSDKGRPRRLTSGPSNNVRPSWSRDGRWIYFGSNRTGDWHIWKEPVEGGAAVQVTKKNLGQEVFESPNGKFVYYASSNAPGIWKVPVEGGEETRVLDEGGQNLWALTGEGICFFDLKNPAAPALKLHSLMAGNTMLLRQFPRDTKIDTLSTALAVSPDGRWILYTQLDQAGSDLMLVENFE